MNEALVRAFGEQKPSVVFLHRADSILPITLERMKNADPGVVLLTYHNDNPFVGLRNRLKSRHFLASIPLADLTLVYRPSNVADVQRSGAKHIAVLPPYYLSYRHRPLAGLSPDEYSEVLYVGHHESDGRAETLDYLVRNGVDVRIYGDTSRWREAERRYPWVRPMNIHRIWGEGYTRLISSAKIALVFLSRANRDVWTRRCFEIPACGTLMLAPRTAELERLFEDGRQAVYYDSKEDLLQKVRFFLAHDNERRQIAAAGRQRCIGDGHSEIDRVKQIVREIGTVRAARR